MSGLPSEPDWITARRAGAVRALRSAVSARGLVRHRASFGWRVRPAAGSVLASPRMAAWDPEPDYFHHWVRDAAVVMRVLPDILADPDEHAPDWWRRAFADYVSFSLAMSDPGAAPLAANPLRGTTVPDHVEFLRPDAELQALHGPARLEEPRCAANGTPDLERWSRPQDDGPALRAAGCIAVTQALPDLADDAVATLIARDLAQTARVAGRACIGPWEEPPARRHSFTLIAQWDALTRGADWCEARGDSGDALRHHAGDVMALIGATADTGAPAWKDAVESLDGTHDSATVLALLHADRTDGTMALTAPRTAGTVAALEAQFAALYPLNRGRAVPAMGRSVGDAFFGGNPWWPVTLGFAELHYRIATQTGDSDAFAKAEGWMSLLRELAPEGDALPEQFDRTTGAPVSCLGLSWSAAALIGATAARRQASAALASR